MSLGNESIRDIRARLHPLQQAEERAKELVSEIPKGSMFVGICGADINPDYFEVVDGLIVIRGVTNPPGIIHVTRAADITHTDYLGISRYSLAIRAEIVIIRPMHDDVSFVLDIVWHTAALLKLQGIATLYCPVAANCSWDTISAVSDHSVEYLILDDIPRQIKQKSCCQTISRNELDWVRTNWDAALDLRTSYRFGLAFNLSYTWNHTFDMRIAVANLWCALEALFGDRNDRRIKAALMERICFWISDADPQEIGILYEFRCDAVHGRILDDADIYAKLVKLDTILRAALIKCIERKALPLPDC